MPFAPPACPPHSFFMFEGHKRTKAQMEARERMGSAQRNGQIADYNADGRVRERIIALRAIGMTYRQVAAELKMSVSACEYYGRKK